MHRGAAEIRYSAALLAWVTLLPVLTPAWAQGARHEARVEAGVARIDQPGTHSRNAFVLSGVRSHADSAFAALLAGNATWARDSVAAAQVIGALAWRPTAMSRWQLEGGASGAIFSFAKVGSDGNGSGWLRVRRQLGVHVGVIVGGAVGHTLRGSEQAHSNTVDLGAWVTGGALTLDVAASRARTEDSLLMAASRIFTRARSAWLDVHDVAATATWAHGQLELAATQRWRRGVRGTDAVQSATTAGVTYAFTPTVALVVSAGRHLADPVRGAPDATTASAAVRVTFAELRDGAPLARESDVSVARMTDGSVLIVRIRASARAKIEVAGSFSGWDPVPITLKGEIWEAQVHVPPGRHRVAYRVDGGAWRAPAGLARLREFNGEVGLIVVP